MSDKTKIILALFSFLFGVVLAGLGTAAFIAAALGWIQLDAWGTLALTVGILVVSFGIGGLLLSRVKDPSWLTVSLPYALSSLYTLFPDLVPLQMDDAAAMTVGALLSAFLTLRKNPDAPRWVLLPLLAAAVYTFFGGAIPGPVDEALVHVLAILMAVYGARKQDKPESESDISAAGS